MTTTVPESAVQFTAHEMLALLSANRGPSEQATRSMLKIADLPDTSDLVRAGFSTLRVRDLLKVDADRAALRGPAKVLSQILTTANLWMDVTVTDTTSTSVTFLIESPGGRVALFVRPGSIVMGVPLAPTVDCTAMGLDMVAKHFSSHDRDSRVSLRRRVEDGRVAAASLRRTADRGWEVVRGSADEQGTPNPVQVRDAEEGVARLRQELVPDTTTAGDGA